MGVPKQSEAGFQRAVVQYARLMGWRVYHTHDSRRSAAGFPDLVFVRERVVYAELKVPPNKATAEQDAWLEALRAAGEEAHLWYPESWPEIEEALGR
jgi:hypothetical protein